MYIADACPNPDWFHLLDSFNEALDSFIPTSFFVGEDIVEHDVFVTAFKLVLNPTSAIKTLIKAGIKHVKKYNRRSLGHVAKELAKDGANGFLNFNFAIKPAINDIKSTIAAHEKVNKRMDFLIRNKGRYVPVRVSQKFLREPDITAGINPGNTTVFAATTNRRVATIGAWAKVNEDLTYKETWKAYLEYFGVNKVVGLAWELIPFSFVVDWFTNAQERINSLTRLRFGGPFVDIQGICSSDKLTTESTLYMWPGRNPAYSASITHPDRHFKIGTLTSTSYSRIPGIPDTSGVVDFSTLGLFHGLAASSLLIQWRGRR
jgi:hypothetical protein